MNVDSSTPNQPLQSDMAAYDGRSIVLNIVSFLLPPLGLVLYLALMIAKLPQKAQSVGRSATFGVGAYILYLVIFNLAELAMSYRFESQTSFESQTAAETTVSPPPLITPPRP